MSPTIAVGMCFDRSFPSSAVTEFATRLEAPPTPVPSVVAGVRGPRSMAVAGRCADGVLLDGPCPPDSVRWAIDHTGRSPEDFEYRAYSTLCVTPERADARRIMAPFVADMIGNRHSGLAHLEWYDELAGYLATRGSDALAEMPDEWWRQIGPIGTLDDAVARVELLAEAGVRSAAMFPADDIDIARGQIDDVIAIRRALGAS